MLSVPLSQILDKHTKERLASILDPGKWKSVIDILELPFEEAFSGHRSPTEAMLEHIAVSRS